MRPVKEFAGFDLDGPRYKMPVLDILRLMTPMSTFYSKLKQIHPHLKVYSNSDIRKYIVGFNKYLAEVAVDHIDGVSLPEHVGIISVCTVSSKSDRVIDVLASNKSGKCIYYDNQHSQGYVGSAYYSTAYPKVTEIGNSHNPRRMYQNCQFWAFKACRNFARSIAQAYKTDWKKYRVKTRNYKLERLFDDSRKKRITKEITRKYKQGYDEFKFD